MSMSSQRANSAVMAAWTAGSACSMPPSVSSENTTPNPKVSAGALRSHTVISCWGPSCFIKMPKYSPPGPPPMQAICMSSPPEAAQGRSPPACARLCRFPDDRRSLHIAELVALQLAGGRVRQRVQECDRTRVFVRRDLGLDEFLQRMCGAVGGGHTVAEDDEGLDDLSAVG